MFHHTLRSSLAHVGAALRDPAEFALRWHEEGAPYRPWVWLALIGTAITGTLGYGMSMGLGQGPLAMLQRGVLLTVAAGLAWAIPLPALYILNSLDGSKLRASTTLLAVLVTVSWGGLALVASIPINWFFTLAIPTLPGMQPSGPFGLAGYAITAVNLIVFTGVGVAMIDVFRRVSRSLEPSRGDAPAWCLVLVAVIGAELMYAFGLFQFVGM